MRGVRAAGSAHRDTTSHATAVSASALGEAVEMLAVGRPSAPRRARSWPRVAASCRRRRTIRGAGPVPSFKFRLRTRSLIRCMPLARIRGGHRFPVQSFYGQREDARRRPNNTLAPLRRWWSSGSSAAGVGRFRIPAQGDGSSSSADSVDDSSRSRLQPFHFRCVWANTPRSSRLTLNNKVVTAISAKAH